jgi:hypothetical protein
MITKYMLIHALCERDITINIHLTEQGIKIFKNRSKKGQMNMCVSFHSWLTVMIYDARKKRTETELTRLS